MTLLLAKCLLPDVAAYQVYLPSSMPWKLGDGLQTFHGLMDWFGLVRTLKIIQFQPLAGQVHLC